MGGALSFLYLSLAGCLMVISRNRWLPDRIAAHVLAAEGDSQWSFFAGSQQEHEADNGKRLGEEAAKSHQILYKSIGR